MNDGLPQNIIPYPYHQFSHLNLYSFINHSGFIYIIALTQFFPEIRASDTVLLIIKHEDNGVLICENNGVLIFTVNNVIKENSK